MHSKKVEIYFAFYLTRLLIILSVDGDDSILLQHSALIFSIWTLCYVLPNHFLGWNC